MQSPSSTAAPTRWLLTDIAEGRSPTVCLFGDGVVRRGELHAFLYPEHDAIPFKRAHVRCALSSPKVMNRDDSEWDQWRSEVSALPLPLPLHPVAPPKPKGASASVALIPGLIKSPTTPRWAVYWKGQEVTRDTVRTNAEYAAGLLDRWPDLAEREWPECTGHSIGRLGV